MSDELLPFYNRELSYIRRLGAQFANEHPKIASRLRVGSHLMLPGAKHEILMEQDYFRSQFWAAFDAFVPGTPLF